MAKMISQGSLGLKTVIFLWVTIFSVSSYTIIEGRHISREEYFEPKRIVEISRRPSIKSIHEDGDIYDCVLIDKQLAFEHPALKNHTIRMKPSFVPDWVKDHEGSNRTHPYIGLKGGGCPVGSVPVPRLQIEDVLSSPSVSSFGKKNVNTPADRRWAIDQSKGQYYGTRATFNIWDPIVNDNGQFSTSQLWIISESGRSPIETVEAGWIVYPNLFRGDKRARFFTYWTRDGYKTTGCWNLMCPGFVQLSGRVPLGIPFSSVSSYEGRQYVTDIQIIKDPNTQDWWLYIAHQMQGYWPKELYNRLTKGGANRVDYGSEVVNTIHSSKPWPQMGSGHFPEINFFGKSCFTSNIEVRHGDGQWYDYAVTGHYTSNPNCYRITDLGNPPGTEGIIAFGGPGAKQC